MRNTIFPSSERAFIIQRTSKYPKRYMPPCTCQPNGTSMENAPSAVSVKFTHLGCATVWAAAAATVPCAPGLDDLHAQISATTSAAKADFFMVGAPFTCAAVKGPRKNEAIKLCGCAMSISLLCGGASQIRSERSATMH